MRRALAVKVSKACQEHTAEKPLIAPLPVAFLINRPHK